MTSLAIPSSTVPAIRPLGRPIQIATVGAGLVGSLILAATGRYLASGAPVRIGTISPWLVLHLATVIPALPLGVYVMLRRKGDRLHRMLGKIWALMMIFTAIVSFGVQSQGHLSPIHLFSVLVLVSVPRGVIMAMRGNIAAHERAMQGVYIGLVAAGLFVFLPSRLLGSWLLG